MYGASVVSETLASVAALALGSSYRNGGEENDGNKRSENGSALGGGGGIEGAMWLSWHLGMWQSVSMRMKANVPSFGGW